jgi:hypothetical protein
MKGAVVNLTAVHRSLLAGVVVVPLALFGGPAVASAKNGDTHITSVSSVQTIDCNNGTLIVNGSGNQITALGTCWAVTVQGSANVIIADTIINDVTVYGWDQTVLYKNGDPFLLDRGRELGMTNRLDRVPA